MRFPSGFDIKNPKMFVTLYSNQKFSTPRQPLLFFDVVKPRRKEYLLSQKIILSDPDNISYFNFKCMVICTFDPVVQPKLAQALVAHCTVAVLSFAAFQMFTMVTL